MLQSKKNILMIDRNFMVDRRIVLEAKLLRRGGNAVALVATFGSIGENEREIDGLPILRFNENETDLYYGDDPDVREFDAIPNWLPPKPVPVGQEGDETRQIAEVTMRAKEEASAARFNQTFPLLRRYLGRIVGGGIAAMLAPRYSIKIIAGSGLPRFAKRPAIAVLAVMIGDLKTAARVVGWDLSAKGNVNRKRQALPNFVATLDDSLRNFFRNDPIDQWEAKVINFALALDKVDVIHVHDLPALRVGVVVAQRRGVPLIYDAHELYSYQPGVEGERKRRLFDTEHRLIKYCAEVVVINADQAEVMKRDHGYDRFTPLTNATEQPEGFDIRRRYDFVRERLQLPEGARTMLFMGGVNRGRNIHLLLEGIARARNPIHMVFLTWGMEIPEFHAMAEDLGIGDRVHFLNPVPWSEIVYWAASVDVGVMPYQAKDLNTRISSPNKMYEFIAAGTPMIGSSELVNVARVVTPEGFGVLLPFHDADDYARAIDEMLDPSKGGPERFRPALIEKADKYLWDSEAQAFAAMYERILGQSAQAAA